MDKKTLIKIGAILILILIVCIIIFAVTLNKDEKQNGKKNGYEDEKVTTVKYENNNKYEPSVINRDYTILTVEQKNRIDTRIDKLIEDLNQKNYESLYNMLDEKYKDLRFQKDIEEFKKYINKIIPSVCHCINYRVDYYGCYINIGFEGVDKDKKLEVLVHNLTYAENSEEYIKLYFEDIIKIQDVIRTFNTPEVIVTQEYIIQYSDRTSIYLGIKNKTKENQEVDFANTQLVLDKTRYVKRYNAINDTTVTVPANGMISKELDFNYNGESLYNTNWVNFRLKVGEKNYKYDSYVYQQEDINEYEGMN